MNHYAFTDKDVLWQQGWHGTVNPTPPLPKPKRLSFRQRRQRCESAGVRFRLNYSFGWQAFWRGRCLQDSGTLGAAVDAAEAHVGVLLG